MHTSKNTIQITVNQLQTLKKIHHDHDSFQRLFTILASLLLLIYNRSFMTRDCIFKTTRLLLLYINITKTEDEK